MAGTQALKNGESGPSSLVNNTRLGAVVFLLLQPFTRRYGWKAMQICCCRRPLMILLGVLQRSRLLASSWVICYQQCVLCKSF